MNFGIIADGNRRWAREKNLKLSEGHLAGLIAIKMEILPVLQESKEFDTCTIYAFSTENWKRAPLEVTNLMSLFVDILDKFSAELIERKIKIIHAGRKDRIPKKLRERLEKLEDDTASFKDFTVYLCIDYGGQDEILRTFEKYKNEKLTEKILTEKLEVPQLDIVLRTGGERRLSNFCVWQSAYAEFFFLEKFLPDIKEEDTQKILDNFNNRNRRVGK